MSIVLDGTNGILSPDFEPSSSTTPTNGLFLPAANAVGFATNSSERVRIDSSGNVGIGTSSPSAKLTVAGGLTISGNFLANAGSTWYTTGDLYIRAGTAGNLRLGAGNSNDLAILDSSGNLGLGVAPSAWGAGYKALQVGPAASLVSETNANTRLYNNAYFDGSTVKYVNSAQASQYLQFQGQHLWLSAPSGTAGNAITFTQAMTLDASGNLLVGTTTSTARLTTTSPGAEGAVEVSFLNGGCQFFVNSIGGGNAASTVQRIGKISTTSRSINAGGTVNASGADYAEYMTKAGDFEIAKGDVCGINTSGLLTNVFSEAVSFVVKSTDPSYVGNDSWGAEIEDKDVLETERKKVDRIAFAGQVPVNVFGAKAGDYIVPVSDAGGIKGEAVSNPTFEQYQIAVGKVIAIESDGRAKIIVKVA